jgi:multidrug resistance efflux pump
MTTAHVEKFAELVGKDPALLAKLGLDKANAAAAAASASMAAYITNAVKEAKAHGLEFTEEEAHAFLVAEAKAAKSGELSDTQLDAVSGGLIGMIRNQISRY